MNTRYKNTGQCELLNSNIVATSATQSASTPVLSEPEMLEAGFLKQKAFDRRNIQLVLSDLGLYKSTIDGFYGSGTQRLSTHTTSSIFVAKI